MSQQRQLRHSFLVTASRHELAVQRARHIAPTAPDRPARIYKPADHSSRSNAFRTLRRDGGFRKTASAPKKAWVEAQLGTVDQYLRSRAGRRHSTANSGTPTPAGGQHSSGGHSGGGGGGCKHMSLKKPAGLVIAAGSSSSAHDRAHAVAHVDANYEMLASLRAYYKVSSHATDGGLHAPGQESQVEMEEGSHFSDAALLKRESLRFDPGVLRQLERLWAFTDANHDGSISLAEYADMFVVLYAALQGGGAEEHVVRKLAREEFAHDAGGGAVLSKEQFKLAWFQLADTWTTDICADAYRAFLRQLVHVMSVDVLGADGVTHERVLRKASEVHTINRRSSQEYLASERERATRSRRSMKGGKKDHRRKQKTGARRRRRHGGTGSGTGAHDGGSASGSDDSLGMSGSSLSGSASDDDYGARFDLASPAPPKGRLLEHARAAPKAGSPISRAGADGDSGGAAKQRSGLFKAIAHGTATLVPTEQAPAEEERPRRKAPPPSLSAFHTVHMKLNLLKHMHST